MRTAIRDVGARLVFLPKYSPDLNPLEQVFAKFQNSAAKGRSAESYEAISDASAKILAHYPPAECAPYLKNAGLQVKPNAEGSNALDEQERSVFLLGPTSIIALPLPPVKRPWHRAADHHVAWSRMARATASVSSKIGP